jgi:DNA replication and repair protein RecF
VELHSLELSGFRTYETLSLRLEPGVTGLFGANGQGKTNLLESLFLASLGWSFRTRHLAECLNFKSNEFWIRLKGEFEGEELIHALAMDKKGQKKVHIDDSKEYKSFSKLMGRLSVVYVGPEDIHLIQGAPQERRSFLDSLLCQVSFTYLQGLKEYQHVLKQRNALLKQENINQDQWDILTHEWAKQAAQVVVWRRSLTEELDLASRNIYSTIAPNQEHLSLSYQTSTPLGSVADLAQFFEEKAKSRSKVEREMQTTLSGPQKDDLSLFLDQHLVKDFGSRGQQRSVALSLRLGCVEWLRQKNNKAPILLLDDIFAELDRNRREALAQAVSKSHQTFIAAPEKSDIPFAVNTQWNVSVGKCLQIE